MTISLSKWILAAAAVSAAAGLVALGERASADAAIASLKSVAEFATITERSERSVALFVEAAKVISNPRCMNCHPADRQPTQGDTLHVHSPPIHVSMDGKRAPGLHCAACHRSANTALVGSRLASVPGEEHWLVAPASMAWQGLTLGEICRQIKDPARNGGRSLADIHKHMSTDHLVGWAWNPGEGRRPAPGSQEAFGALIGAWIETGAECPE